MQITHQVVCRFGVISEDKISSSPFLNMPLDMILPLYASVFPELQSRQAMIYRNIEYVFESPELGVRPSVESDSLAPTSEDGQTHKHPRRRLSSGRPVAHKHMLADNRATDPRKRGRPHGETKESETCKPQVTRRWLQELEESEIEPDEGDMVVSVTISQNW